MLVLSRKYGERVLIGEDIEVVVLEIKGRRVKLGIQGPSEVPIHRKELSLRIAHEGPFGRPTPAPLANSKAAALLAPASRPLGDSGR